MGVFFFLKDGMKVEPSTLQIVQYSSNMPMVAKPLYGILSDSFYIFGQHRVPYIALGGILMISFFLFVEFFYSVVWLSFYLRLLLQLELMKF